MQSFQYTPSANLLVLNALIATALAIYIWDRRKMTGAKPVVALLATMVVWSAGYMLELMGSDLETKLFWAKIQYLGIATLPVALFLFALEYSGRNVWLTASKLLALTILPYITFILALSNESHHLIWSDWQLVSLGNISVLHFEYGLAFWANTIYAYGLLTASTVLIVQALIRRPSEYRGQILSILVGIIIPWITNAISYLVYHFDLTPFVFIITSLAFAWAIYKHNLFESVPNAF